MWKLYSSSFISFVHVLKLVSILFCWRVHKVHAILVNICSPGSGWKSTLISRFKSLVFVRMVEEVVSSRMCESAWGCHHFSPQLTSAHLKIAEVLFSSSNLILCAHCYRPAALEDPAHSFAHNYASSMLELDVVCGCLCGCLSAWIKKNSV